MASPILDKLTTEVANATTVMASAELLIEGIASRIQLAVDAALENGATAAELAPVQAEADALQAASSALSEAVIANTPAVA